MNQGMRMNNKDDIDLLDEDDEPKGYAYPRGPQGGLEDDERGLQVPKLVLPSFKGTSDLRNILNGW